MASVVQICNLALINIGERGTIASIDPPEGSTNAEYVASYYPLARDSLLEMHTWSFASRRKKIAEVTNLSSTWNFCYATPIDLLSAVSVLAYDATNDYYEASVKTASGQDFVVESTDNDLTVIYTNQENAVLRYQSRIIDSNAYPSLFVTTLSWLLSSMIAGTVIKGKEGADIGSRCIELMNFWLNKAVNLDMRQRNVKIDVDAPWISGR